MTPSSQARQAYLGHDDPELRRDQIQPLASILADPMQVALATGAGLVLDVDDDLNPRPRCAGKAPRLPRRLRARASRPSGALTSRAVSPYDATCSTSSRPSSI